LTTKVDPFPLGHHAATPCLCVRGAARAIDFYRGAFGAREILRVAGPDGEVAHAELRFGEATIMLADESAELGARSPHALGGSPVIIHLYVDDPDRVAREGVVRGARMLEPVQDRFRGDRAGSIEDPFGHVWRIATRREGLRRDETQVGADARNVKASKRHRRPLRPAARLRSPSSRLRRR
jgi:PhnB protein